MESTWLLSGADQETRGRGWGRVRLVSGEDTSACPVDELGSIPGARQALVALEEAAVLTVVTPAP